MFVRFNVHPRCGSADDLPVAPPLTISKPALLAWVLKDLGKTPAPVRCRIRRILALLRATTRAELRLREFNLYELHLPYTRKHSLNSDIHLGRLASLT